jgi:hypothetical protein
MTGVHIEFFQVIYGFGNNLYGNNTVICVYQIRNFLALFDIITSNKTKYRVSVKYDFLAGQPSLPVSLPHVCFSRR